MKQGRAHPFALQSRCSSTTSTPIRSSRRASSRPPTSAASGAQLFADWRGARFPMPPARARDPARRRQLRLRLVARARAVGARRLRLPRGRSRPRSPTSSAATRSRTACCPSRSRRTSTASSSSTPEAEVTIDVARATLALPDGSEALFPLDPFARQCLRKGSTSSATCAATRRRSPYGRRVMVEVEVYDTTLRDGTQREGISLSAADKLRIAERLDELGVAFIEGGWPGSNPKDAEFFARARERSWQHAEIVAFGATRRADIRAADDAQLRALVEAGTPRRAPSSASRGRSTSSDVLRTTREENLRMIEETRRLPARAGRRVIYDAEHFFDGWRADPELRARDAARGGARRRRDARPVRHQRRLAAVADRRRRARRGGGTGRGTPRHPRARRRRLRRGQHARGGARRRAPRAGHDQRLRRALRQRQPVHGHPRPRAQAGPALPAAGARCSELTELSRFVAEVANLGARRPHALRRALARSPTRAACTWRRCGVSPEPTSTSIRRASATRRASW